MEREVIIESLECINFGGIIYILKHVGDRFFYGATSHFNDKIFNELGIKDKRAFQSNVLSIPPEPQGVWPYGGCDNTIRLMVALINYACVNGFIDRIKVAKTDGLLQVLKRYGLSVPPFASTLTDSYNGYDIFTRGYQSVGLLAQVEEHCSGKSQEDTQLRINVRHRNIKFNFNN